MVSSYGGKVGGTKARLLPPFGPLSTSILTQAQRFVAPPGNSRVLALLVNGLERVEFGWCQGALARDGLNRPVKPAMEQACRWCARGALEGDHLDVEAAVSLLEADFLVRDLPRMATLEVWNDAVGRTQADVIALYRRTIASLS